MLLQLKRLLQSKAYRIYSRPYELNIVGLRSRSVIPNRFDDELHVFFQTASQDWEYHVFRITTDPGTYWLLNPMQQQGTAILAMGQYVDAYEIGLHRGQYSALVQVRPISVLRDYNRNAVLDFKNGIVEWGLFGINIHRAEKNGTTTFIEKYSAGCQVFENAQDFAAFMQLCDRHRQLYGNRYTYTLLDFRAMHRQQLRYISGTAGLFGIAGIGIWAIQSFLDQRRIAAT